MKTAIQRKDSPAFIVIWLTLLVIVLTYIAVGAFNFLPRPDTTLKITAGQADCSHRNWSLRPLARLEGEWLYLPHQLAAPDEIQKARGKILPKEVPHISSRRTGAGTYYLHIDTAPDAPSLALRIPRISSSYRLFVNGELLDEAGHPSLNAEDYRGQYKPGTLYLPYSPGGYTLVLQTANHTIDWFGMRYPPTLGTAEAIHSAYAFTLAMDMLIFGSIMMMGLYHLVLFVARTKEKTFLFFGLLCLVVALRVLIHNEHYLYRVFPEWDLRLYGALQVATFYLAAAALGMYLYLLYPGHISGRLAKGMSLAFAVSSLAGFLLPYMPQMYLMHLIQAVFLFFIIHASYLLVRQVQNREVGALFMLLGMLFLIVFALHDVLITLHVISGSLKTPLGLFFFVLFHSGGLSWSNAQAFRRSEGVSRQLRSLLEERETLQKNLEMAMEEKTMDLETAVLEIQRARDEANKANQAKTQFLANVSHEMRTPLNGIIGFTEILDEAEPSSFQADYLRLILQESQTLLDLINELLDLSKIESRKFQLVPEVFRWDDIRLWLTEVIRIRIERKGLTFHLEWDDSLPPVSFADERRIRQVLMNLLGNALKFTEEGSITVRFFAGGGIGGFPSLRVEVEDTGVGIPLAEQKKIFDPFYQTDGSSTRVFSGTGLGTTISRMLVTMMGGEISLSSQPSQGSTFSFELPLPPVPEDKAAALERAARPMEGYDLPGSAEESVSQEKPLEGRRILLAEDYPTNQRVVIWHLNKAGAEVVVADNGRIALEKYDDSFDLILMDIQMPEMDGLEATRILRKERSCLLPIVGLTANAYESDRRECFEAGMTGIITKPVRKEPLIQRLLQYLEEGMDGRSPGGEFLSDGRNGDSFSASPPEVLPVLDWEGLNQEMGGNPVFCRELVLNFISLSEERMKGLLQEPDPETERIHRDFHTIKGGAMNIMAHRVEQKAREAEALLKTGHREDYEGHGEDLLKEIEVLKNFMHSLEKGGG